MWEIEARILMSWAVGVCSSAAAVPPVPFAFQLAPEELGTGRRGTAIGVMAGAVGQVALVGVIPGQGPHSAPPPPKERAYLLYRFHGL